MQITLTQPINPPVNFMSSLFLLSSKKCSASWQWIRFISTTWIPLRESLNRIPSWLKTPLALNLHNNNYAGEINNATDLKRSLKIESRVVDTDVLLQLDFFYHCTPIHQNNNNIEYLPIVYNITLSLSSSLSPSIRYWNTKKERIWYFILWSYIRHCKSINLKPIGSDRDWPTEDRNILTTSNLLAPFT